MVGEWKWKAAGAIRAGGQRSCLGAGGEAEKKGAQRSSRRGKDDKGTTTAIEGKKKERGKVTRVRGGGGVIRMEKERADPKTQPSGSARGDDAGEGVSNRARDMMSTRENAIVSNVENKNKMQRHTPREKSKYGDQRGWVEERRLTLLSQMAIELGCHL